MVYEYRVLLAEGLPQSPGPLSYEDAVKLVREALRTCASGTSATLERRVAGPGALQRAWEAHQGYLVERGVVRRTEAKVTVKRSARPPPSPDADQIAIKVSSEGHTSVASWGTLAGRGSSVEEALGKLVLAMAEGCSLAGMSGAPRITLTYAPPDLAVLARILEGETHNTRDKLVWGPVALAEALRALPPDMMLKAAWDEGETKSAALWAAAPPSGFGQVYVCRQATQGARALTVYQPGMGLMHEVTGSSTPGFTAPARSPVSRPRMKTGE